MRTCEEYEALISAFIDGALDDDSRGELMVHMAQCPACQAYFDDQIAIHDALEGMEAQAPADFTARVMEQVRREARQPAAPEKAEKKTVTFPYWRRFAAMAACCAVVALAGFWAFGGQPDTGNVAADTAVMDTGRSLTGTEEADAPPAENNASGAADDVQADALPEGSEDTIAPDSDEGGEVTGGENTLPPVVSSNNSSPQQDPAVGQNASVEGEEGKSPAMYTAKQNAPVVLTTDSQVAADWVTETLGQTWEAGASYTLTEEQFSQVKALLAENGENFTELTPENGTGAQDSLSAGEENGDSSEEQAAATYVLQAAP